MTASHREPADATVIAHPVCSHASVPSLQLSVVHDTPSLQSTAVPGWHDPPPHTSLPLQKRESLQGSVLLAWRQPLAGTHESVVQTFASSQLNAGPGAQAPPAHVSVVVHALPSLHAMVLFACAHPVAGTHESVVQTFPSSQPSGVPN